MLTVTFSKNPEGLYHEVRIEGHAEYAEMGHDIVCAGISALFFNAVNSIVELTSDEVELWQEEETEISGFRIISSKISDEAVLLMDSLILGLNGIADEYGDKYIVIIYR
ncbi:MAG: ribosomal-processing cysteine protease Prp [Lachnospiraceae bacterium]|nr:ribosomal-processing cysteine protease Prp [Lachnospiraceae bacterium]